MNRPSFPSTTVRWLLLVTAAAASPAFADGGYGSDEPASVEVTGHYEQGLGVSSSASEGRITATLIANRPALRPGELLEFVPGVIVTQHSGDGKANQYFLRGFNLDHGTDFSTWVDGMPVNMVSHAHGQGYSDLNFVIPELVRLIQYRKGPYYASDGDFSSAGSARMQLADELPRGLAKLTLGDSGYRRAVLGNSTPWAGGTLLGAFEAQTYDGPWQVPQALRRANGWLRWSRRSDADATSLTLMAYGARWTATDQIPLRAVQAGTLDRFGSLDATDGGRTRRTSLSLQHSATLDNGGWQASAWWIGSRLNLWSNFTYFLDDPVNGDQFEQAERRRTFGGEVSRRWILEGANFEHQATVGLQLRHDRLSPVGLYHSAGRARLSTTVEAQVQQTHVGLWGEVASTWTPWLRTVAGVRADTARTRVDSSIVGNSGRASDHLASPKLSIVLGPWERTEAFVNLGRGFHSNDARGTTAQFAPDGSAADAVPPLVPSRGEELGLRTLIVPGLQSSLALWRLRLDSELVYIGDAGSTEPAAGSRRRGIEWSNHWTLAETGVAALAGWNLDVDLAASRARFDDGSRVPGAVGRVAALGLHYASPAVPWFGGLQVRHFGPRDLVEDGGTRSSATTLAYARVGWRVASGALKGASLSLDVFNLFDREANDIEYLYESQLAGEAAPVEDRHFHPVEPRRLRLTLSLPLR